MRQVTILFLKTKCKQQAVRRKIGDDKNWLQVTAHSQARHSLIKLLRLAVFNKHISTTKVQTSDSAQVQADQSTIEPVLQANLMGDEDKEFVSLLAYLQVTADDIDGLQMPTLTAGRGSIFNDSDYMLDMHSRDVRFRLQYLPDNYLTFYLDNFYRQCNQCGKKALEALCLICGRCICLSFCYTKGPNMI